MSPIAERKVRRQCHWSSFTTVERIVFSQWVAEGVGRIKSSHSTGVTLAKNENRCSFFYFWCRETVFVIWKKLQTLSHLKHKDTLWFCVYASYQCCNLRSQFSKLTASTAQWSKTFIIMLAASNPKDFSNHTCVCPWYSNQNWNAISQVLWLLCHCFCLGFYFQSWRRYCAIILHIIAAD